MTKQYICSFSCALLAGALLLSLTGCTVPGMDSSSAGTSASATDTQTATDSTFTPDLTVDVAAPYTATWTVPFNVDYTMVATNRAWAFSGGFAAVTVGDNYGFMDPHGNVIGGGWKFAYNFDSVSGLACVQKSDGTYALVNKSGTEVISSFNGEVLSDTTYRPYYFFNGLTVISDVHPGTATCDAVIDATGNVVIPFDRTNLYIYSLNGGDVILRQTGNYSNPTPNAVLDLSGHVLFTTSFSVSGFENGVGFYADPSAVSNADNPYPPMGRIDIYGNKLTAPIYTFAYGFHNGLAAVQLASDGTTGYINHSGTFVVKDTTGAMSMGPPNGPSSSFSDNIIVIGSSLYAPNGQLIATTDMDWVGAFSDGLAACEKDGKYGVIDAQGNVVIAPTFQVDYDLFAYSEGLIILE